MKDDPIRLRDDPSRASLLREDLDAAATATPPVLDLAGSLARFEATLGKAAPTSGAAPAGATAASGVSGIVWTAAIVGVAGLIGATILATGGGDGGHQRRAVPTAAPRIANDSSVTAARTPPPERVVEPPAPAPPPEVMPDTPRADGPRQHVARVSGRVERPSFDPVTREVELVGQARALLPNDAAAALAAVETARREVPGGALAEEREALAILALHALGREDEARRLATAYLEQWSTGTQRARIRRVLDQGEDR